MDKYKKFTTPAISMVALMSLVVLIVIPLHPLVIDFAIVTSFAMALVVFLRSSFVKDWDDIKTFPTILLLTAVFRIALNITTTRVILTTGEPGNVIEASGQMIVGEDIWVGFVIFIILIVVQFIIANGASRMSEVSARFKLDSLPGKQLSIDTEFNNQSITQEEATEKRKKLDMEVDYHGNMDGAGKYIKGDVWAGIVMIVVNIVFGFIVGMTQEGLTMAEAAYKYTLLTVGDGIVNQLCSLLITVGAGLVLTKVSSDKDEAENLVKRIFGELTTQPIVLGVVGLMFLFLGFFTEMPFVPFMIAAIILGTISYLRYKNLNQIANDKRKTEEMEAKEENLKNERKVDIQVGVEPITLEVGFNLIPIVDPKRPGANIKDKALQVRKNIANELGIQIPNIKIRDNSKLFPNTKYNILIKNSVVATGNLKSGKLLAIRTPFAMTEIEGEVTKDPVFGSEAKWIAPENAQEAENSSYEVLDPLTILVTHLEEMIRMHSHEFLPRQKVRELIDKLEQEHPILLEEMKSEDVDLSLIQKVCKNLITESISIQDLPSIMEAVLDTYKASSTGTPDEMVLKHPDNITMHVRQRINRQICEMNKNDDGNLYFIILDNIIETIKPELTPEGYFAPMNMNLQEEFISKLKAQIEDAKVGISADPILLTSNNNLRPALMRMIRQYDIRIPVMSMVELHPSFDVEQIGMIQIDEKSA